MFAPTVSPVSVFAPDPESPGEIAPKNMKCVAPQLIEVPERGVPPGNPRPVPCPKCTICCARNGSGLIDGCGASRFPFLNEIPATAPVFVNTPRGPPQKAIVGVTSDWYSGLT